METTIRFLFLSFLLASLATLGHSARRVLVVEAPAHSPSTVDQEPPSQAPSSASADCSTIVYDMVDCISFLTDGSEDTEPTESCCAGYEAVLGVSPVCLCEALAASASMQIAVNLTRAYALSSSCGINAPDVDCGTSMAPAASPEYPPESSSPIPEPPVPPTDDQGSPAPSTEPPASQPSTPSSEAPAPALAPSEGGAYSTSVSLSGLVISLLVASLSSKLF